MRTLFNRLSKYLPEFNYNMTPLIYIRNDNYDIRVLYNIDRRKQVMYSSTISNTEYRYMSVYGIFYGNWEIISVEEAFYITQGIVNNIGNDLQI